MGSQRLLDQLCGALMGDGKTLGLGQVWPMEHLSGTRPQAGQGQGQLQLWEPQPPPVCTPGTWP